MDMQDEFSGYTAPCLQGLTAKPAFYDCGAIGESQIKWPSRRLVGIARNGIIMPLEMLPPADQFPVPCGEFVYEDKAGEQNNG